MRWLDQILNFVSASRREHNRDCPDVLLKVGSRGEGGWRKATFSVRNVINHQLLVTEIALVQSWGCEIAPAIGEFDTLRVDTRRVGRTFRTSQVIRIVGTRMTRQEVAFYVKHPRDHEGAPHYFKVSVLIEHRMDPSRRWRIVREGQLPQSPGDPAVFGPRGPHLQLASGLLTES